MRDFPSDFPGCVACLPVAGCSALQVRLINWLLRVASPYIYRMTQRLLANPPPLYAQRMAANAMYALIR